MLDIKKIKENPQAVKDGLHAKEVDCDATVDKILVMEEKIRSLKTSTETQTAQKNKLSKENGKRKGRFELEFYGQEDLQKLLDALMQIER